MLFDFTDDQVSFARSVEALLEPAATPRSLREAWRLQAGDDALWRRLADVGLLGLLIDESAGGMGASAVDAALALERIGYHAVAAPVVDNVVVLPMLLAGSPAEGAADRLSRVAAGTSTVSQVLSQARLATYAQGAEVFIVAEVDSVHLVPREQATITPVVSTDPGLGLAEVRAETSSRTEVARGAGALALLRASSAMAASLLLVGTAQRMLDLTCGHVLARKQFGQPLGAFQAVKHALADAAVHLEVARGLSWYAAYAASHQPESFAGAASRAKAAASEAAAGVGRAALQFHGGIGFTWEHDLHLYLQRANALKTLYGSTSEHRVAVGKSYLRAVHGLAADDREGLGAGAL